MLVQNEKNIMFSIIDAAKKRIAVVDYKQNVIHDYFGKNKENI